ncbi:LamG domain-containing protein [Amphritea sp. HPY]|uniref:LamG domain-containing protein n=1 Tax=Amphritea sp. HPY TaxID=3421652 RepID=UPI003D7D1F5B
MKKFSIFVSALAMIFFTTNLTFADLTSGLVAYYPFNGNADDASGNMHHGTVSGATSTADRFGNPDSAYMFGGLSVDDYIEVPNPGDPPRPFDLVDSWTLIAWVRPDDISEDTPGPIIWKIAYNGGNEDTFGLFWITGTDEFFGNKLERASDGLDFVVRSSGEYLPGEWHCAVGIYDGTNLKINVNGVLEESSNIGSVIAYTGPEPLRIGNYKNSNHLGNGNGAFQGIIDDVRIYDRALSDEEIQELCSVSISVAIDIHPDSFPNSINLCSNGTVPIGILGSDTFNVFDINTETLRFAETAVKVVGKKDPHSLCSYEDINDDSIDDLVCHYLTSDIAALDGDTTSATVNGELLDGTPIEGTDSVNIVKDTCH